MNLFESICNQILRIDPFLKSNVKILVSDLHLKVGIRNRKQIRVGLDSISFLYFQLKVLERYEQYLKMIDNEISNRLMTSALTVRTKDETKMQTFFVHFYRFQTDIYEQCPCPKEFAHQLTHIELVKQEKMKKAKKTRVPFASRID